MADEILVGRLSLDINLLKSKVDEANVELAKIGQKAKENAKNVSKTYADMATNMANAIKNVEQAQKKVGQSTQARKDAQEVKKATEQYRLLTTAIREWQKASKGGHEELSSYWNKRIGSISHELQLTKQNITNVSEENGARQKVLDTIKKSENALASFNKNTQKSVTKSVKDAGALSKSFDSIWSKLKLITGISIAKMWYDALR